MKNKKDEKWLEEKLSSAIDFGQVKFDSEKWKEKYILNESAKHTTIKLHKNLWRFIMESRITKYSTAAGVVLGLALILLSPFGNFKDSGIVWAKVVDKVQQVDTVIFKEQYLFWEIGQEESYLESNATKLYAKKYASEENGVAEDVFDEDDTLIAQVYNSQETKQFILVLHSEKKFKKLSMQEDWFKQIAEILTPLGFLEYFTSGKYTELQATEFESINVEGFETSDPNIVFPVPKSLGLLFPVNDMVLRIWIDTETSLPVSAEAEFNTARGLFTGFEKLHCKYIAYDFQWNAEIPQELLKPVVPDDYTEFKVTDLISAEAKTGVLGLGILPIAGIISLRRHKRKKRALIQKE